MNMTYSGQYPEQYIREGHLRSYFKVIVRSTDLLTFTKPMLHVAVTVILCHPQFRPLIVYNWIAFAHILVATVYIEGQL